MLEAFFNFNKKNWIENFETFNLSNSKTLFLPQKKKKKRKRPYSVYQTKNIFQTIEQIHIK